MKTWKIGDFEISINPFNGGYQCTFNYKGKWYWADLCYLHGYDVPTTECMIFHSDENGNVLNWTELYCNRCVEFSMRSLVECIKEFEKDLVD